MASNVLFLNPPSPPRINVYRDYVGGFGLGTPSKRKRYGHDVHVIPPLFEAYAAAFLESQGITAAVLDAQVNDLDLEETIDAVVRARPDLVVSRISLPSYGSDLELMTRLKGGLPKTLVAGWGAIFKVYPAEPLQKSGLDLGIRGELEPTVLETVEKLQDGDTLKDVSGLSFKQNGEIVHNRDTRKPMNLDSLPLPAYHLLDIEKYILGESSFSLRPGSEKIRFFSLLSSRGCSYACVYCPYPLGFGPTWRGMSPKKVVDEIEHLAEKYKIQGFWFRDQTWSMDIKRAIRLCDEIVSRKLDVSWVCETRADRLPRNLLEKMKQAGCAWVQIGVETGDPEMYATVGKEGSVIEDVRESFRDAREVGLLRKATFMVGLPGETWDTIKESRDLVEEIDPDDLVVSIVTPYPGTPLYNTAKAKDWLLTEDWNKYTIVDSVMKVDGMTSQDLVKARRYLLDDYRKRKMKRRIVQEIRDLKFGQLFEEARTIVRARYGKLRESLQVVAKP